MAEFVTRDYDKKVVRLPQNLQHKDRIIIAGKTTDFPAFITVNLIRGTKSADGCEKRTEEILFQFLIHIERDKTLFYHRKSLDSNEVTEYDAEGWHPFDYFKGTSFEIMLLYEQRNHFTQSISAYIQKVGQHAEISLAEITLGKGIVDHMMYLSVGGDVLELEELDFKFKYIEPL